MPVMFRAAVAEERLRASVLPGVNTLVRVTVGTSPDPAGPTIASDLPSRVEDLISGAEAREVGWQADMIWVAVPHYGGDVEVPERGTACRLTWPTPVGLYELPVAFHGRDQVGPAVRAWRLRVTGSATRAQRRRYVRVPWTGAVTIEVPVAVAPAPVPPAPVDGAGGPVGPDEAGEGPTVRALAGAMVDLSEGGLRCLLPPPVLPAGQRVRVVLPVAGQVLTPPAQVVWTRPSITPVGTFAETGICFDDPEAHGDLLRRVVFSEQLRARRAGLA
jgi:hypothetical protein